MAKTSLQQGFTLVELAIVLMIIGLLIGGILRGQELMENARVNGTIQQVKAYQGAVVTFHDAYGMMPGDMVFAKQRLAGCTDSPNCLNGNGDGVIGTIDQTVNDHPWTSVPNGISTENTQFWNHLALAHLISGVTPNANAPEWGRSHPVSKIGGGFFARYSVLAGGNSYTNVSGHMLVMRSQISGQWVCDSGQGEDCEISGQRASQIDRKMDDGMAVTGDVIAISSGWASGCGTANTGRNGPDGYSQTDKTKTCDMMFKL